MAGCGAGGQREPGQGSRLPWLRNNTETRAGATAPPTRLPAPLRSQIRLVWGSQGQPQPHGQPMERGRGRWQQIPFLVAAGMQQLRPRSGTIQPCRIYSPSSPWRYLRSEVPTTAPFPWVSLLRHNSARPALPMQGGDPPAPLLSPVPLPSPLLVFQVSAASQRTTEQTQQSFREWIPQISPWRSPVGPTAVGR